MIYNYSEQRRDACFRKEKCFGRELYRKTVCRRGSAIHTDDAGNDCRCGDDDDIVPSPGDTSMTYGR